MQESTALITNDAAVLGLLAVTLGAIFYTANSERPFFKKFYRYAISSRHCTTRSGSSTPSSRDSTSSRHDIYCRPHSCCSR
jgi:hypothetical protein